MIGRELNPRIGSFDIKYFVELRPGITEWTIINIAMAVKQYHDLGYVTIGMILVIIFQGWYCIDSVYNEVSKRIKLKDFFKNNINSYIFSQQF